jgi:Tfp pilus assembly protein PilV
MRTSSLQNHRINKESRAARTSDEAGFSLAEMLISSLLFLVLALALFGLLNELQRTAVCWTAAQQVLENTRIGIDTAVRALQQAGNDPHGTGFEAITIEGATECRIRSDLTGSTGAAKGDPDGDTEDSWEDIIIRYNPGADTFLIVHRGGRAQTVVQNISDFSLQFFDETGLRTNSGAEACTALVTITGVGTAADPMNRSVFAMRLSSYVQLAKTL